MVREIEYCKQVGCNGVVLGILQADGSVDKARCALLVEAAYPLGVTFHRAFDWSANPFEALETIIGIGCERILTSGQRPKAYEGVALIDQLVREADERIVIMPGSGVRSANIAEIAEKTGASEFHTSARILKASAMAFVNAAMKESQDMVMVDADEVRKIKDGLAALEGD